MRSKPESPGCSIGRHKSCIAAAQLNLRPEDLCFAAGRIFAASNPEHSLSFARVAAASHWFPDSSPEPRPTLLYD
jgi:hypothetical protein